ncbi:Hypothetical_protein [Hexamita inflata]|uniref:Hypothetical_protein n=1 Tax=Hexamita inflata TaxID=28002 RepID=A0AA86RDH2_9EUKA|nr:Hypothetical protein HINF_LOCUS61992 [Hexamita inflata]
MLVKQRSVIPVFTPRLSQCFHKPQKCYQNRLFVKKTVKMFIVHCLMLISSSQFYKCTQKISKYFSQKFMVQLSVTYVSNVKMTPLFQRKLKLFYMYTQKSQWFILILQQQFNGRRLSAEKTFKILIVHHLTRYMTYSEAVLDIKNFK